MQLHTVTQDLLSLFTGTPQSAGEQVPSPPSHPVGSATPQSVFFGIEYLILGDCDLVFRYFEYIFKKYHFNLFLKYNTIGPIWDYFRKYLFAGSVSKHSLK